jgi:hypothetical protein
MGLHPHGSPGGRLGLGPPLAPLALVAIPRLLFRLLLGPVIGHGLDDRRWRRLLGRRTWVGTA